jgi:hypothetical protein
MMTSSIKIMMEDMILLYIVMIIFNDNDKILTNAAEGRIILWEWIMTAT